MKIALVVHDFLRGVGHGRYCIELANRFAREHDVHVFANRFEQDVNFQFNGHRIPAWRATALTSVLTFPHNAEKFLARERFDIVHAQGFSCWKADVITAHVCNAARYRIAPVRRIKDKLFPALVIPRERKFYRQSADAEVIAVSKVVQREIEKEYGNRKTHVIYHGVNADEFTPPAGELKAAIRKELGLPAERWLWMFAGEASKGLPETMRALRDFPEAHLLVVSRSPANRRLARTIGATGRVTFHGPTESIAKFYQASDVFVYPSQYDTFGMVVAEAMACGLPVVVGTDIGAAEWVRNGENGFVCDPNDVVPALRKARSAMIADAARATALAHTWDDCAAKTLTVYQRVIESRRTKE